MARRFPRVAAPPCRDIQPVNLVQFKSGKIGPNPAASDASPQIAQLDFQGLAAAPFRKARPVENFERVADPEGILVVDLRPLRPLVHAGKVEEMSEGMQRLIFRADMLLLIGGGRTGGYKIAHGTDGSEH